MPPPMRSWRRTSLRHASWGAGWRMPSTNRTVAWRPCETVWPRLRTRRTWRASGWWRPGSGRSSACGCRSWRPSTARSGTSCATFARPVSFRLPRRLPGTRSASCAGSPAGCWAAFSPTSRSGPGRCCAAWLKSPTTGSRSTRWHPRWRPGSSRSRTAGPSWSSWSTAPAAGSAVSSARRSRRMPFVDRAAGRTPEVAAHGLTLVGLLIGDPEPDVQKALSWALRSLARVDPVGVTGFCRDEAGRAAATEDGAPGMGRAGRAAEARPGGGPRAPRRARGRPAQPRGREHLGCCGDRCRVPRGGARSPRLPTPVDLSRRAIP